ncbi:MAG: hypothetical protein ACYDDG_14390, partial [Casimicrobiaceae bacterium]
MHDLKGAAQPAASTGRLRRLWFGLAAIVPLLVLWYVLTSVTHTISPGRFPSPNDVLQAARQISRGKGYAGGTFGC